jgi:succinate dehydrogenase / fumarate reductase cytochrome b subunit
MMNLLRNRMVRGAAGWFDWHGRGWGMLAFIVNRVTGIGLVVYLLLHLVILTLLAVGPVAWDVFVALAKSPLFLLFDLVLFAGMLLHGLNGIRLALAGFGIGLRAQGALFLGALLVSLALFAWMAIALLGGQ